MESKNCSAKMCINPVAISFDTSFNCQQETASPLKIIIELIPGIEEVYFGTNKYNFLVVIGAMFDKEKIISTVLEKVDDFINDNNLMQ
jgi:hypothetical protein